MATQRTTGSDAGGPAGPQPGRRRRPAEVRGLLIEAAADVFATSGYAVATKRDIAERAGVALSVLDRHFETKAGLFAESTLVPFAEFLEDLQEHWLKQRDEPVSDEPLMRLVITDLHHNLMAHRPALVGLVAARDDIGDDITQRVRAAFENLFRQLRLMAELEAEQRKWFSADGLDDTIRTIVGMVLGATTFDWILASDISQDEQLDNMSKLALWGLARRPPDQPLH